MNVVRETALVVQRELRRNFRSARGLALYALTLLGGIISAMAGVITARNVNEASDKYGSELVDQGAEALYTLLYRGDAIVASRLAKAPPSIVITAWASVWLCPLLVALVGFDSISAERQHRTIRYMTVRTRRPVYFVGKWLGLWATAALAMLGVQIVSWLCDLALVHNPVDAVFGWGAAMYLVTVPILGAWSAVATFVGSMVKTPMIALLLIFGVFGVQWVIGNLPIEEWHYHTLIYPGSLDHYLLHPEWKSLATGLGACLAFPLLFIGAGSMVFQRAEV